MPRYFFNIREGAVFIADPEGTELPHHDAMLAEARQSAREMTAERMKTEKALGERAFEITDESGRPVAALPFRDLIR